MPQDMPNPAEDAKPTALAADEAAAADWRRLPTGYFTHPLADRPSAQPESPDSPDRIEALEERLIASGLDQHLRRVECGPASRSDVLLAHDADYLSALERASAGDAEALKRFDAPDAKVGPDTFACAMASAGAVVAAVDEVFARRVKNAFCAVRPPGHHAGRARAAGFCFINSVAVGALHAVERWGLERVAVLDFDAHHGDGTEEILAGNPCVKFFSLFQWPFYPNRRLEPAPSNVVATSLPAGADGADIRRVADEVWLPALVRWRPQAILLSAGFDAHAEERMAQLKAGEVDFAYLTRRLVEASAALCEGRLVSALEGGYSIRSLSRSVLTHLQMLCRPAAATDLRSGETL